MKGNLLPLLAALVVILPPQVLADGVPPTPMDVSNVLGGAAGRAEQRRSSSNESRDSAAEYSNLASEVAARCQELWDAYNSMNARIDALAESDRQASREWEDHMNDGPTVPTSCREGPCGECYGQVVERIDRLRYLLITARNRASATVDLWQAGDNLAQVVSGVHAAAGIYVHETRGEMLDQPIARLREVYENKAGQMLANLERALRDLGTCEAKFFGVTDWYERFGYMYMTYMRDKYEKAP